MEEDIVIEVYIKDEIIEITDSRGQSDVIKADLDSLTIQDCIDILYCR